MNIFQMKLELQRKQWHSLFITLELPISTWITLIYYVECVWKIMSSFNLHHFKWTFKWWPLICFIELAQHLNWPLWLRSMLHSFNLSRSLFLNYHLNLFLFHSFSRLLNILLYCAPQLKRSECKLQLKPSKPIGVNGYGAQLNLIKFNLFIVTWFLDCFFFFHSQRRFGAM